MFGKMVIKKGPSPSQFIYRINEPKIDVLCLYDESWYNTYGGDEWDKDRLIDWVVDGLPKGYLYATNTLAVKVSEDSLFVFKDTYVDMRSSNYLYRFDTLRQKISISSWCWIMEAIQQLKQVDSKYSFQDFSENVYVVDYMTLYTGSILPLIDSSSRSFIVSNGTDTKTLVSNKTLTTSLRDSCQNNDIEIFDQMCKIHNIHNIKIFNKDYVEIRNRGMTCMMY